MPSPSYNSSSAFQLRYKEAMLSGLEVGELASFCLLFLAVNHSKAGNKLGLGVGLVLGSRDESDSSWATVYDATAYDAMEYEARPISKRDRY